MGSATKTDNLHLGDKLALRRRFLDRYHRGTQPMVFDACQGSALLWTALREQYRCRYWGVDVKAKPGRLKIDSARILAQPGWEFDVIDVDTYGSPWKHWAALLPNVRRPLTVFLTAGMVQHNGVGSVGADFLGLIGMRFRGDLQVPPVLSVSIYGLGIDWCLGRCYDYGLVPRDCAEIERPNVRYIGIRLEPANARARDAKA